MGHDEKSLTSARDELRSYQDQQQAALTTYFSLRARADKMRANLFAVEAEQRGALAQLARSTDAKTAARLTSTSVRQAREALVRDQRESSSGADSAAAG